MVQIVPLGDREKSGEPEYGNSDALKSLFEG
jgi:hypothetical protein